MMKTLAVFRRKRPLHALCGDLDSASHADEHFGDGARMKWASSVHYPLVHPDGPGVSFSPEPRATSVRPVKANQTIHLRNALARISERQETPPMKNSVDALTRPRIDVAPPDG